MEKSNRRHHGPNYLLLDAEINGEDDFGVIELNYSGVSNFIFSKGFNANIGFYKVSKEDLNDEKYNSKLFARDIYLDIANARIDRTKKLKTHLKRNSHLEQIFHEQIIPRIKKMVDDKKTSSTFKIKTIPKRKQKPKIKYGARFASNGLVNKKNHNDYQE